MVAAIRQTVTVQSAGKVEVCSPDLHAGARAEVIVLIETDAEHRQNGSAVAALDALQAGLQLTAGQAADWTERARAERQVFGQPT